MSKHFKNWWTEFKFQSPNLTGRKGDETELQEENVGTQMTTELLTIVFQTFD